MSGSEPGNAVDDAGAADGPALVVDVAGFEGPLDLLLHLARRQKVDLARISILALAEQYLAFVAGARALRFELAADYLVTASWLAFLKSKLLLPDPGTGEEAADAEEMAAALQFRLRRLDAMRDVGARLMARDQLGQHVFARGMPERFAAATTASYSASLHDLLSAYAERRQRRSVVRVNVAPRDVWSLDEARSIVGRVLGAGGDWVTLDRVLREFRAGAGTAASAVASGFAATLELVREGRAEIRQEAPFAAILLRGRESGPAP